jgi:hypothetical protein
VSTMAVTESPGTSRRSLAESLSVMRMRTGTRWTILVKLPVALLGGISEKLPPCPARCCPPRP